MRVRITNFSPGVRSTASGVMISNSSGAGALVFAKIVPFSSWSGQPARFPTWMADYRT